MHQQSNVSPIHDAAGEISCIGLVALGGKAATVSRFLWSESLTIGLLALVIVAATRFLLRKVFVLMLGTLFTIPPTDITISWTPLLALAGMIASTLWGAIGT